MILFIALLNSPAAALANHSFASTNPGDTVQNSIDSVSSPKKMCSCKVLQIKTGAFETERETVALFAEKTIDGKLRNEYKILNSYLRREKIYFRIAYLESMVMRESFKSTKDCSSLYKELKGKNRNLRMYNIIDVDALTLVASR
jgi:hypothetical protein